MKSHHVRIVAVSGVFALALPLLTQGRVTPVTAKHRMTYYEVEEDGSRNVLRVSEGIFLRSANGTQFVTYHPSPDPSASTLYGTLKSASRRAIYQLNQGSRTAILKQRITEEFPRRLERAPAERQLGTDSSSGIPCAKIAGVDGSRLCIAYEHDLVVRMEFSHRRASGKLLLSVSELYEVQLGQEPASELLDIPADYQILEPERKQ